MKKYILFLLFGIHLFMDGQTVNPDPSALPFPYENINLVTDRDLYFSGEPIWFTANASLENNQEAISKILYIELFNSDQKAIIRKKYSLNKGFVQGTLDIPSEFLSDVYYLRAYTLYDQNFPEERYFITAVQIINPKNGIPTKTKKEIVTEHALNTFSLELMPPKNGMQFVSVYNSQTEKEIQNMSLSLELLDNEQQIISAAEFYLSQKPIRVAFPDSSFKKPGLYYYLLKDQNKDILKVRAFLYKDSLINESKPKYTDAEFSRRSLVNIDMKNIISSDPSQIGIKIVQKGSILSPIDKLNFFMEDPRLLMNYLKYQFDPLHLCNIEESTILINLNQKLNLDEYKTLFNSTNIYELKRDPELIDPGLSGIAIDKNSQKALPNIPILLSISSDRPIIYVTVTKGDGSFQFPLNYYHDNLNVMLSPILEEKDEIELKINEGFSSVFPNLKPMQLTIDSTSIDFLEQMLIGSQTSGTTKIKSMEQEFNIHNLPYSFDDPQVTVVPDNFVETPTLEMFFKELVLGAHVRKINGNYKLFVLNIDEAVTYDNPLVLVDDVPIIDIQELMKIPPKDIEKIEVHYLPFAMEKYTIFGIISLKTKKGDFGGLILPKSTTFLEYQALSPDYQFGAKTYTSPEEKASRLADFRTTLYWNPSVPIEINSQISFYTSDQTASYDVLVFGTYKNGLAFYYKLFNLNVRD